MQKAYKRTYWENYPSDVSEIDEVNLNNIETGIDEIDNRILALDTTKFDKIEAQGLFKDVSLNRSNGVITFTLYNGATKSIDTLLEKIAVNFDYDPVTQRLIITLDDGTVKYIDMSALITQYEFLDSDTAAFSVNSAGKVTVIVKEGSIGEKHLQPNYLADIKLEVAKAQASQQAAADSETNAKASEKAAKQSEVNAKTSEDAAKVSETSAASSAESAEDSANIASASATSATNSATSASNSAASASNAATSASGYASSASNYNNAAYTHQQNAAKSETAAATSAANAADSATEAESYAHGGTGTRENEDIDNAKYYYQQSKSISESFAGALRPMGTVTFANLPVLASAAEGDMYNVSDQFTTTASFKEGSGNIIPAGANIYKTADGYWDVLAGSPVTGVKGDAETTYHRGNVNLTPDGIGALSITGDSKDNTTTFTAAATRSNIASGEKHSTIFGKIAKFFADMKTVAFTGSYSDLTNKPTIPAAVAVKGNAESSYRTGNVNLTADNIGALPKDGTAATATRAAYVGSNTSNNGLSVRNYTGTPTTGASYIFLQEDFDNNCVNVGINGLGGTGVNKALTANTATKATQDGNGNDIANTYATKAELKAKPTFISGPTYTSLAAFWEAYNAIAKSTGQCAFLHCKCSGGWTPAGDGWYRAWVSSQNLLGNGSWDVTGSILMTQGTTLYWGKVTGGKSNSSDLAVAWTEFSPVGHTHSYLPLSGGTVTGTTLFTGSVQLTEGQAILANGMYVHSGGTLNIGKSSYINLLSPGIQCRNISDTAWSGISAASFTNQSSRRYKKNIEDMTDEVAKSLLDYRVVSYDYINEADGTNCLGLIAEEVAEICEYPVIKDKDGNPDRIDYSRFTPQLIKMVQIQQNEINEQKETISDLLERIERLESSITTE